MTRHLPRHAILVCTVIVLGAVCIARHSNATPNFPAVVQQFVQSQSPPSCTICHNSPNGGLGTVTTPFGKYLRSRGLVELDEGSLRNALTAAQAEGHDSNGDGVTDIEALREGLDPNGNTGGLGPPVYGCGIGHRASRVPAGAWAIFVALVVLGVCIRRRSRQSAPNLV
jgi:hypothetical protein